MQFLETAGKMRQHVGVDLSAYNQPKTLPAAADWYVLRVRLTGNVLRLHDRLAAQNGCFLLPGRISGKIDGGLILYRVILRESFVIDGLLELAALRYSREFLFPNLDEIAEEIRRFATSPNPDFS